VAYLNELLNLKQQENSSVSTWNTRHESCYLHVWDAVFSCNSNFISL